MADASASGLPGSRQGLSIVGPGIQINEGEFVPAALTLELGPARVSVPLGAFTVREGKARFVATIDVVGLSAVVFGIGVAALGVRTARPVVIAIAERLRSN